MLSTSAMSLEESVRLCEFRSYMFSKANMKENGYLSVQNIDQFLASVEKKAFRMARLATVNDQDALDIVQDSMIKLVINYGSKAQDEWRLLFYRILQNQIRDWHRRDRLRKHWVWNLGSENNDHHNSVYQNSDQDSEIQGLGLAIADEKADPAELFTRGRTQKSLLKGIEDLPRKQQQCFLLRAWEGLSVAETAQTMKISEGSVKTHFSRAISKLNALL